MDTLSRDVIDIDSAPGTTVKVGGRDFFVRQQPIAQLRACLSFVVDELQPAPDPDAPARDPFRRWEESLPVLAIILGAPIEDGPEKTEVIEILRTNLGFADGRRIFERWWAINDIDDFFALGGELLLHKEVASAKRLIWKQINAEDMLAIMEVTPQAMAGVLEQPPTPTSS